MPALGPVQTNKQISTTRRRSFHEIQFPIYMPPKRKNLKSIIDDLEPGSQDNNGSDDGSEFFSLLTLDSYTSTTRVKATSILGTVHED